MANVWLADAHYWWEVRQTILRAYSASPHMHVLPEESKYLYSHRVFGIRLLQKCRPVCQYYEKYQIYDGVNIKGGKQPMVTG